MTHADRVREAERTVVEAAVASRLADALMPSGHTLRATVTEAVDALLALRAATCTYCDGYGTSDSARDISEGRRGPRCPANCDAGRRREP